MTSRVLDTLHTPGSHTGERLSKELKSMIDTWEIQNPTVVTDNASNVKNAVKFTGLNHVGCAAHTLNLSVNKALDVELVKEITGKCRRLVSQFKMSALKTDELFKAEEKEEIGVCRSI